MRKINSVITFQQQTVNRIARSAATWCRMVRGNG